MFVHSVARVWAFCVMISCNENGRIDRLGACVRIELFLLKILVSSNTRNVLVKLIECMIIPECVGQIRQVYIFQKRFQNTSFNFQVMKPHLYTSKMGLLCWLFCKRLCRQTLGVYLSARGHGFKSMTPKGLHDCLILNVSCLSFHCKYPICHHLIDVHLYKFFTCLNINKNISEPCKGLNLR